MGFRGVDHVVIAVKDFESAIKQFEAIYGMPVERGTAPGMKTAFFRLADSYLELVTNDGDEGPIAKRLNETGDGIHLIAMRTDDMDGTLKELRASGVRLIGDPGEGNPVTRQVFIHPASAGGILTQIIAR